MTRGRGNNEKTLYDKSLVGRARSVGRRPKRAASALLAFGLIAGGTAVGVAPAHADADGGTVPPAAAAGAYGGFTTTATAAPLKLEVFEPAIPIPTDPQGEFDFSYTRVLGGSGPATTARASALWPGAAVGEGLKTFGQQLGLPGALTDNGYPVQANAGFPGDTTQQSQEFVPGMIGRVEAGDKRTVAKVGYSSSDVSDGDAGDGKKKASTNPLDALNQLVGAKSGPPNPLGTLGLLIDVDGMTSVSSTDYDGSTVIATATSRIGEVRLLGGLISLNGVNVVTKVTSSLDGGAKTARTVDVGGITIAGQKFSYGPDGLTAVGKNTPIPGIPSSVSKLLKMLGVAIEVPAPDVTAKGTSGSVSAEALRITLDTKPLRSKLPSLPLDGLVNQLPPLPGQANILKGLLLSLNTIAPKIVVHLGAAQATADTVSVVDLGGGPGTTGPGATTPDLSGGAPAAGDAPAAAPDALKSTPTTVPVAKGLPPLRSLPMLLLVGGLALAAAAAWYLRYAGLMLFGGSSACAFGLKVGIPDLRKA
jgi:hypothetical protein